MSSGAALRKSGMTYTEIRHKRVIQYPRYSLKKTKDVVKYSLDVSGRSSAPGTVAWHCFAPAFCAGNKIPRVDLLALCCAAVLFISITGNWNMTVKNYMQVTGWKYAKCAGLIKLGIKHGFIIRVQTGVQGVGKVSTKFPGQRKAEKYFLSVNGHAICSMFYDHAADKITDLEKILAV